MNERIKELEKQSFITTETQKISGAWDNTVEPFRYVTVTETNFSLEKFAELIVKECTTVIEGGRFLHNQAPTALFAKECSGAIKRHFGVKE
jgi:hypothetical protein